MPKRTVTPFDDARLTADSRQDGQDGPPAQGERQPEDTRPKEYGGRKGPDPVRYGDWEKDGRCIDF